MFLYLIFHKSARKHELTYKALTNQYIIYFISSVKSSEFYIRENLLLLLVRKICRKLPSLLTALVMDLCSFPCCKIMNCLHKEVASYSTNHLSLENLLWHSTISLICNVILASSCIVMFAFKLMVIHWCLHQNLLLEAKTKLGNILSAFEFLDGNSMDLVSFLRSIQMFELFPSTNQEYWKDVRQFTPV